jgi:hypothetical protein
MERRKRNTCVSYGLQSKYDRSLSERWASSHLPSGEEKDDKMVHQNVQKIT